MKRTIIFIVIAVAILAGVFLWREGDDAQSGIPIQLVDAASGTPIARQRAEIKDSSATCESTNYCPQPVLFEGKTDGEGKITVSPDVFSVRQFNVLIEGYYLGGPVQQNSVRQEGRNVRIPNEYTVFYPSGAYRFNYLEDSIILKMEPRS